MSKSIAEKIRSWMNTFRQILLSRLSFFSLKKLKLFPDASIYSKDMSSRKPVNFSLGENISFFVLIFLTKSENKVNEGPGFREVENLLWVDDDKTSFKSFCRVSEWNHCWGQCWVINDIRSLSVHQSSKPDVLPSPARAPSVPRISRLSSWGGCLGKETCHHFEDSKGLWSFKTGLRKEFYFEV